MVRHVEVTSGTSFMTGYPPFLSHRAEACPTGAVLALAAAPQNPVRRLARSEPTCDYGQSEPVPGVGPKDIVGHELVGRLASELVRLPRWRLLCLMSPPAKLRCLELRQRRHFRILP